MVLGPSVGGALFELGPTLPFYAACGGLLLAACMLATAPSPQSFSPAGPDSADRGDTISADRLANWRLVAWVGLFFAYLAMGMMRYQLPSLARALAVREAVFGIVMTVLSLVMAGTFLLLSRSDRWHFRRALHALAQLALAAIVAGFCWVDSADGMALAVSAAGVCIGLVYASSIFYSASGPPARRTSLLAVHEMTLPAGFVCGSLIGGSLSEYVSLRAAYPACAALILLGLLVQLLMVWRKAWPLHRPAPL
ncbi:MAG: MFS transporter [Phycisphaerae bacterium]